VQRGLIDSASLGRMLSAAGVGILLYRLAGVVTLTCFRG
jgi:hypothetical protein